MKTQSDTTLSKFSSPESAIREYEKLVWPARERFASSAGIRGMIDPETEAQTMAAFLLHFSALSVPITEPVEGWIRRAGDRCAELGLGEIARSLHKHSKAEAGHDQYHLNDFASLIAFWNARWSPPADPTSILEHKSTAGGERYCRLHEDNIAGSTPYCQFAIEYEIELLPVIYGSQFVENCVQLLGQEILSCMSFVTSHVEFDVGHTKFNSHFLGNLILEDPSRLAPLAEAGARLINDMFLPQISKAPGFVSYYAVDSGSGTLTTVSVFESQWEAEESNRQAADFVKENLPALTSGPPEITSGVVIASQIGRSGAQAAKT